MSSSRAGHELNTITAIAMRDVSNAVRNPTFLIFTMIFPVIFLGLLGTTMSQSLGQHLGYNLPRFMFIGMLASTLYQGAMNGMTSLVEDRQDDFTQEMFVAPVSRYSILLGKAIGSSLVSLASLVSLVGVALVLRISIHLTDLADILLLAPLLALSGAALGALFIGLVNDPKVAGFASFLLVFPQMFLSGALIPISQSTGVLALLTHALPMTYLIDLERHLFYPDTLHMTQHSPALDLAVTGGFCTAFLVTGTTLFTHNERNR